MSPRERTLALVVLPIFSALFLTLTVTSFVGMSPTYDEPVHLTTGYLILKSNDCRIDPEHPPLLRMWAALPLLLQHGIKLPDQSIDNAGPSEWIDNPLPNQIRYASAFVYKLNGLRRMLYPARFMIGLLGVFLGILIFFWAREWLGFWPAVLALAFYTFEPNILAHSSLVTTDLGVTCFLFGSVYFLCRTVRCLSMKNLSGLVAMSGLTAVSKFSAIALGPIFLVLLTICVLRAAPWPCRIGKLPALRTRLGRAAAGAGILLLVAFACWGAIWAVYGFRYLPSPTPGWRFSFEDRTREEMPLLTRLVHEVDQRRLLPNVYSQGFLLQQSRGAGRDAFLAGTIRKNGWWYYFPFAFLIKTPVSLILFLFGGLIFCALKWRVFYENALFVLLPPCLYLGAAMASDLNIGLRHILPIYPFIILLAALCGAELLRAKRMGVVALLGVLSLFWVFEVARVFPHDLAFFNSFIGGPQNGYKYLADSNIDWGQDLEGVKRWMDQQGVKQISLDYFGFADPSYYGIQYKKIGRGTEHFIPPRLPGYVAVSVTLLDGIGLSSADSSFYRTLIARQPSAVIGYSIRIYWAGERWWPSNSPAEQTTGTATKTRVLSRVEAQEPGLSQAAQ